MDLLGRIGLFILGAFTFMLGGGSITTIGSRRTPGQPAESVIVLNTGFPLMIGLALALVGGTLMVHSVRRRLRNKDAAYDPLSWS